MADRGDVPGACGQSQRIVRSERYKLVFNATDLCELYDLESDPWELTNRYEDPAMAGVRQQLFDHMLVWMEHTWDPFIGDMFWRRGYDPTMT